MADSTTNNNPPPAQSSGITYSDTSDSGQYVSAPTKEELNQHIQEIGGSPAGVVTYQAAAPAPGATMTESAQPQVIVPQYNYLGYEILQPGQTPKPGVSYAGGEFSGQLMRVNNYGSWEIFSANNQYNPNAPKETIPKPGSTGLYISYQGLQAGLSASYTPGAQPYEPNPYLQNGILWNPNTHNFVSGGGNIIGVSQGVGGSSPWTGEMGITPEPNKTTDLQQRVLNDVAYFNPSDIGDVNTQKLTSQGMSLSAALNQQMMEAQSKGDTRAAGYFQNELGKSLQNNVVISSDYHHVAMDSGLPQPANPYEYVGDLSLAALSGSENKNTVNLPGDAGAIVGVIPKTGLGEQTWGAAPDYGAAINVIETAKATGDMGPYATLGSYYGDGTKMSVANAQAIAIQAAKTRNEPFMMLPESFGSKAEQNYFGFNTGIIPRLSAPTAQANVPAAAAFAGEPVPGTREGAFLTGDIAFMSKGLGSVPGSYSTKTISETQSEPSLSNFALNLGGNLANTLSFGLIKAKTDYGFASRTVEDTYQKEVPAPFVANAPTGYTPTPAGVSTITSQRTESEKSVYDVWQKDISNTLEPIKLSEESKQAVADYQGFGSGVANVAVGAYSGVTEKPLDVVKYVSLGVATGGLFTAGGAVVESAAAGTRVAPYLPTIGKGASYAMGGLYAYNIGERSTSGFTDFGNTAYQKAGGIVATEAAPLIGGAYLGSSLFASRAAGAAATPAESTIIKGGGTPPTGELPAPSLRTINIPEGATPVTTELRPGPTVLKAEGLKPAGSTPSFDLGALPESAATIEGAPFSKAAQAPATYTQPAGLKPAGSTPTFDFSMMPESAISFESPVVRTSIDRTFTQPEGLKPAGSTRTIDFNTLSDSAVTLEGAPFSKYNHAPRTYTQPEGLKPAGSSATQVFDLTNVEGGTVTFERPMVQLDRLALSDRPATSTPAGLKPAGTSVSFVDFNTLPDSAVSFESPMVRTSAIKTTTPKSPEPPSGGQEITGSNGMTQVMRPQEAPTLEDIKPATEAQSASARQYSDAMFDTMKSSKEVTTPEPFIPVAPKSSYAPSAMEQTFRARITSNPQEFNRIPTSSTTSSTKTESKSDKDLFAGMGSEKSSKSGVESAALMSTALFSGSSPAEASSPAFDTFTGSSQTNGPNQDFIQTQKPATFAPVDAFIKLPPIPGLTLGGNGGGAGTRGPRKRGRKFTETFSFDTRPLKTPAGLPFGGNVDLFGTKKASIKKKKSKRSK